MVLPLADRISHHLLHLQLHIYNKVPRNLLLHLLKHSPKLEILKLTEKHLSYTQDIKDQQHLICDPSSVPECLSFHLKTFQWRGYEGTQEEIEIAAYILQHASCLKTASISIYAKGKGPRGGESDLMMMKELESMFKASTSCQLVTQLYNGILLSWKSRGPKDLLCRVCLVSAVSSALFTNDTSCMVLTEFVLKIARQKNLPPHPFLLALATSANIGSSATPIGNPQNLISFWEFLVGIFPTMIVGITVNAMLLLAMYWRLLSDHKDYKEEEEEEEDVVSEVVVEEDITSHRFSPAILPHRSSFRPEELSSRMDPQMEKNESISTGESGIIDSDSNVSREQTDVESQGESNINNMFQTKKWRRVLWKASVYLITLGMLISLLMGSNMSWTAITAALALIVLDFKDARPSLEKVSYSLLVFFCGMFISVDGFNTTGIPTALWDLMEPYAKINQAKGTIVLAIVILVLSNVASNVPTVLLLGARVAASAVVGEEEKKAWLILAWVSTVAGNLTLLGSAANLIVCEQARRAVSHGYTLTFTKHLKFGLPSTLIVTTIGLLLIN
ncbi:hypothetical protein AALP_AA3G059600 [Arabis alpina]|uniref:FBD domain-containing protein n=1 Tax=Arabis alpina TaxID=50452 RepID=A0A087H7B6_ARAAL|nr:hypothetical protein AALP_AA3G059600 [Arabis alpina]